MKTEQEITYRGIQLEVEGDYTPAEKGYMYDGNLDGLPDSGAEFDVNAVFVQDTDIYDLLGNDELKHISELVIGELEK